MRGRLILLLWVVALLFPSAEALGQRTLDDAYAKWSRYAGDLHHHSGGSQTIYAQYHSTANPAGASALMMADAPNSAPSVIDCAFNDPVRTGFDLVDGWGPYPLVAKWAKRNGFDWYVNTNHWQYICALDAATGCVPGTAGQDHWNDFVHDPNSIGRKAYYPDPDNPLNDPSKALGAGYVDEDTLWGIILCDDGTVGWENLLTDDPDDCVDTEPAYWMAAAESLSDGTFLALVGHEWTNNPSGAVNCYEAEGGLGGSPKQIGHMNIIYPHGADWEPCMATGGSDDTRPNFCYDQDDVLEHAEEVGALVLNNHLTYNHFQPPLDPEDPQPDNPIYCGCRGWTNPYGCNTSMVPKSQVAPDGLDYGRFSGLSTGIFGQPFAYWPSFHAMMNLGYPVGAYFGTDHTLQPCRTTAPDRVVPQPAWGATILWAEDLSQGSWFSAMNAR
ncbi:MAG: hypothetical protein ACYSWU_01265, partial [Planctomycetota bacterium]